MQAVHTLSSSRTHLNHADHNTHFGIHQVKQHSTETHSFVISVNAVVSCAQSNLAPTLSGTNNE